MTVYDKAIKYLERCKHPKTLREISEGGRINHSSLRNVLGAITWQRVWKPVKPKERAWAWESLDGKIRRYDDGDVYRGGVYRYSIRRK